jgi:hypothetical protein
MSDMEHIMDAPDADIIAKAKALLRGLNVFCSHLSGVAASAGGLAENISRSRAHPAFEPLKQLGGRLESMAATAAEQAVEFDAIAAALAKPPRMRGPESQCLTMVFPCR